MLNLKNSSNDNFIISCPSSPYDAFKQTSYSSFKEDSSKLLPEVNSSRFLFGVGSLNVLFVDTSFSFLSNVPLDENHSLYFLLYEAPLFDFESSEDSSTIETILSKDIIEVDLSSHGFVDEVSRDAFGIELFPSYFKS